jgi:hypothetical protein
VDVFLNPAESTDECQSNGARSLHPSLSLTTTHHHNTQENKKNTGTMIATIRRPSGGSNFKGE